MQVWCSSSSLSRCSCSASQVVRACCWSVDRGESARRRRPRRRRPPSGCRARAGPAPTDDEPDSACRRRGCRTESVPPPVDGPGQRARPPPGDRMGQRDVVAVATPSTDVPTGRSGPRTTVATASTSPTRGACRRPTVRRVDDRRGALRRAADQQRRSPRQASPDDGRRRGDDEPDEPAAQFVSAADAARVARMSAPVLVIDGGPRYHLLGLRAPARSRRRADAGRRGGRPRLHAVQPVRARQRSARRRPARLIQFSKGTPYPVTRRGACPSWHNEAWSQVDHRRGTGETRGVARPGRRAPRRSARPGPRGRGHRARRSTAGPPRRHGGRVADALGLRPRRGVAARRRDQPRQALRRRAARRPRRRPCCSAG